MEERQLKEEEEGEKRLSVRRKGEEEKMDGRNGEKR